MIGGMTAGVVLTVVLVVHGPRHRRRHPRRQRTVGHLGVGRAHHRGRPQPADRREADDHRGHVGPRLDRGPRRGPGLRPLDRRPAWSPRPAGSSWSSSRPWPAPAAITVVEPDGTRQPAARVGTDATTGITVLRIADDLPAAEFTDTDPATGSVVVAMAMEPRTSARGHTGAAPVRRHRALRRGRHRHLAGHGVLRHRRRRPAVRPPTWAARWSTPSGAVSGILDAVDRVRQPADVGVPPGRAGARRGRPDRHPRLGRPRLARASTSTDAPVVAGVGGGAAVESVTSGGAGGPGRTPGRRRRRRRGRSVRAVGGRAGHPPLRRAAGGRAPPRRGAGRDHRPHDGRPDPGLTGTDRAPAGGPPSRGGGGRRSMGP